MEVATHVACVAPPNNGSQVSFRAVALSLEVRRRNVRVPVAVGVFIGTSVVLAVALSFVGLDSSTAGGIEIMASIVATVVYWRATDPGRKSDSTDM